jgi:hypothetical protein
MALQWWQPPNSIKAAKTLSEILIALAFNYASTYIIGLQKICFT